MTGTDRPCPICGSAETTAAFEIRNVPTHTVVVYRDRDAAEAAQTGDMRLACCRSCGFVFNRSFDPGMLHYRYDYESTQAFSEHFNTFSKKLAAEILAQVQSTEKPLLEIGCGQGEFLQLLEAGGHRNLTGFDPAFDPERSAVGAGSRVRIFAEEFTPALATEPPTAIVCKMTLEHIGDPIGFLKDIAAVANQSSDCKVLLQVPNAAEIFRNGAFWDVYYEHCNYFTVSTLTGLLVRAGLYPLDQRTGFDAQYLLVTARSGSGQLTGGKLRPDDEVAAFGTFLAQAKSMIAVWDERMHEFDRAGKSVALWGAGSKAVAFLSALENPSAIKYAIDINPRKSASYLPKTGLKVVGPAMAGTKSPDVIIVMNPTYFPEIRRCCTLFGLRADMLPIFENGKSRGAQGLTDGRGGENLRRSDYA